jgi:hypothetical protein
MGFQPKHALVFEEPRLNAWNQHPDVPIFPVSVDPTLDLDPSTLARFQKLADQLTGHADVPNARLDFYSAFVESREFKVTGWQGILMDAEPNPGGTIVKLGVMPAFAIPLAFAVNYYENYLVRDDGAIQFLGTEDPLNFAGRFPDEFLEF